MEFLNNQKFETIEIEAYNDWLHVKLNRPKSKNTLSNFSLLVASQASKSRVCICESDRLYPINKQVSSMKWTRSFEKIYLWRMDIIQ